ncbi:MAG TPA: amidohydrolase family protein [Mycobacteriales bacterium]|nr:amidohydrolase family protein [Mycobacteriales bacterium]
MSRPVTLHRAPVVLPVCAEPIRDGCVEVCGDTVGWVGPVSAYRGAPGAVRDWPGVLTPGLVNAHCHLQYTDFADLADFVDHTAAGGVPFADWMMALVARRAEFTEQRWRRSAERGIAAVLASGTTCVADVVTDPCVCEPLFGSGLTGVAYLEAVAADDATWAAGKRAGLLAALDRDTGPAVGGLRLGVSPHSPYTLGTSVFAECVTVARERGLRLHPHLAETVGEVELVRSGTGRFAELIRSVGWLLELVRDGGSGLSPAAYLDGMGALGPDVHVAHGVHLDAADRALLRQRGTAVALCARSNAILGAGEPPVATFRAEGSPVAVGTDSLASSPSLDLLAELAALRRVALGQGSPEAGLDRWLVEAATVGGARALGLTTGGGAVGVLRPGVRADLAAFDVPTGDDPYAALVAHGAGRCAGTVLAGRVWTGEAMPGQGAEPAGMSGRPDPEGAPA